MVQHPSATSKYLYIDGLLYFQERDIRSEEKPTDSEKRMWFWQTTLSKNFPKTPFPYFSSFLPTSLQLNQKTPTKYLIFFLKIPDKNMLYTTIEAHTDA